MSVRRMADSQLEVGPGMNSPSLMSSSDNSPSLSLQWVSLVLGHGSSVLLGALRPRTFLENLLMKHYSACKLTMEFSVVYAGRLSPGYELGPVLAGSHSPCGQHNACTLFPLSPQPPSRWLTYWLSTPCHIYLNPSNCILVAFLGVSWPSWGNHSRNLTPCFKSVVFPGFVASWNLS